MATSSQMSVGLSEKAGKGKLYSCKLMTYQVLGVSMCIIHNCEFSISI